MDYDLEKVAVKQAAMDQAVRTLIVGDSSKFRRSAVARFGAGAKTAAYVTEALPPPPLIERLKGKLVIAGAG